MRHARMLALGGVVAASTLSFDEFNQRAIWVFDECDE